MSKRNDEIIESRESRLLKDLRIECGLSLSKLADEIGYSKARVYQMESGREQISEKYIELFLEGIKMPRASWLERLGGKKKNVVLDPFDECISHLEKLNSEDLVLVLGTLRKLAS